MSKIERCIELKPTCSSSTLAANGKASEARTMMVERTIEDQEPSSNRIEALSRWLDTWFSPRDNRQHVM
jgi:hypothetical protein